MFYLPEIPKHETLADMKAMQEGLLQIFEMPNGMQWRSESLAYKPIKKTTELYQLGKK